MNRESKPVNLVENKERESIYKFGNELAHEAGQILLGFSKKRNEPIWKGPTDFKTQADNMVANLVRERIRAKFPTHSIWSEELPPQKNDQNWWFNDELDGTLPFARGYSDRWSFSLGFQSGGFKFGFINMAGLNKLFEAVEGEKSYFNGERINVSSCEDINRAIVGWDAGKGTNRTSIIPFVQKLFSDDGATYAPSSGCATAGLMSVANGELDAYIAVGLGPEDMTAAVPIIRGAGGKVTAIDGTEWHPHCGSILASNLVLHQKLLEFFR